MDRAWIRVFDRALIVLGCWFIVDGVVSGVRRVCFRLCLLLCCVGWLSARKAGSWSGVVVFLFSVVGCLAESNLLGAWLGA